MPGFNTLPTSALELVSSTRGCVPMVPLHFMCGFAEHWRGRLGVDEMNGWQDLDSLRTS